MLHCLQIRIAVSEELYFLLLSKQKISSKTHKAVLVDRFAKQSFTDAGKYITHSTFAYQLQIHNKLRNKHFVGLEICNPEHVIRK